MYVYKFLYFYINIYIYVCFYIYTRVDMFVYIYICVYKYVYLWIYMYIYIYIYIYMYICIYICTYVGYDSVMCVHIRVNVTQSHVWIWLSHMCVYVCGCDSAICVSMCVDMTQSYHDLYICGIWLSHMCAYTCEYDPVTCADTTQSYAWTWPNRICGYHSVICEPMCDVWIWLSALRFPQGKDPCGLPQGHGFFPLWDLWIFENLSLKCLWDGSGVGCNVAQPNSRRREVGWASVYWCALGPPARTFWRGLGCATLQPTPEPSHKHFRERFSKIRKSHKEKKPWPCGIPQGSFPCGKRNAQSHVRMRLSHMCEYDPIVSVVMTQSYVSLCV